MKFEFNPHDYKIRNEKGNVVLDNIPERMGLKIALALYHAYLDGALKEWEEHEKEN